VYQIVSDVVNHQFKGGFHVYGVESDGVGYAMDKNNQSLIPSDVLQQVEQAKQKIISGQIQVTDAMNK
ncbi:MAG: basic rane protein, partial [Acidobacteriota bacterium]|nr:basic rane protein [Acidobacteriota bacterium]